MSDTPLQVLIVEDDPMVMRLNVEYLNRLDDVALVAQCGDVPGALDVLERDAVDVILLDVYLRGRNGLEIIRYLQRLGRDIDVILITAASETETVRAARRLGVRDYLVKPFEFERFKVAVDACRRVRATLEHLPEQADQRDLDRLFQPARPRQTRSDGLPKGLTTPSLAQIAQAILSLDEETFTTESLIPATGMSRVSVRKYLKYLTEHGYLGESFHYGQVGRPSFTYRCLDTAALQGILAANRTTP
ncbi:response regulator [Chromohalobacter beijerinckii]|uniref:Transcriptional regulatory protein n=1 Tax=Chromohalobacter beijerinckii TaxID=86179 RepID=A0ABV8XCF7_9GAMM|nr:response regulator [Chromohalobacter beijerinckii]MCK0766379.1 response regulator [Chromohalobacter beijerinckii]